MIEKTRKNIGIWDVIWAAAFICSFIFIWWKCRFGFGNADESFYLTIPYRLCQGDGLLAQEWHLTQLGGFLLLPIMKVFLAVNGGTEGIILAFRHIYVVVQAVTSAFIFIRLRKMHRPGAAACSVIFMIFAPYGIMALSYNSMGIIYLEAAMVIMLTAERARPVQFIIAGILFACAVLCCPYLLFLYVVYVITVILARVFRRGTEIRISAFRLRNWLFFTIGAAAIAVVFAAFVLRRASFSVIIAVLPSIMNDGAHESAGILKLVYTYFRSILALSLAADIGYALTAVITVAAIIDRKRREHALIYYSAATFVSVLTLLFIAVRCGYINYVMFPLNLMSVVCVIICGDEDIRRLFLVMWIPGMIYTFCVHAASNQLFYAISMAFAVPLTASVMIICRSAEMLIRTRKGLSGLRRFAPALISIVLIAAQLAPETVLRYRAVFWESMDILQKELQTEGTERGLHISQAAEDGYRDTLGLRDYIDEQYPDAGKVIFISDYTWLYLLCEGRENSSYSAWLCDLTGEIPTENMERLMKYYEIFPEKIPELIYIEKRFAGYEKWFSSLADYSEDTAYPGGLILVRQ